MLSFGSVCSGIEAASVAWEVLGWKAAWLAEIDKAASEVLAYRFPDVPNYGDMLLLADKVRRREIPAPDILVGGTPCQSFSVAGMRRGLSDARGQLTIAFIDLANAIDEIRAADGLPPVIIIWENVPGVLNHADNPLGCFLAGLAGDDDAIEPGPRPESQRSSAYWTWDKKARLHRAKWPNAGVAVGPQRAIAWRVLDAQYFGLAQRRRRVFVVASARQGFDPAAILLEFDGVRRDSPPSREAGEGLTHPVAPCLTSSGRGVERTGDPRGQDAVVAVSGRPVLGHSGVVSTLDASYGKLQGCSGQDANHGHSHLVPMAFGGNNQGGPIDVATACNAHGGPHGRLDFESETFVVAPVEPELYAIMPMNSGKDYKARKVDIAQPLMAGGPVGGNQGGDYIVQPIHVVHGTQDPCVSDSVAFALQRNSGQENVICFSSKDYGADAQEDLAPTLRAGGHADSHANAGVPPAIAYSVALRGRDGGATAELGDDLAGCLRASSGGGDKPHVLAPVEVLPFDTTQITSPSNYSQPKAGDPCHPLAAGAHPPAVCVTGAVTHTLKAEGFDASEDGTGRGQPIVPARAYDILGTPASEIAKETEVHTPLRARTPGQFENSTVTMVAHTMAVRRLMPVECERLQGFPDNWTLVPTGKHGKPAADGPRYKQCGNSMATRVMRWIGVRVAWHLATLQPGHNGGPPLDEFDLMLGAQPDPLAEVLG